MRRSKSVRTFLSLRAIRIYPALVVETVLSALILGPIVTSYSLHDYFTGRKFWGYLTNCIGWPHYSLPGVFETNPQSQVNSALWTVPFELECYILISVLALVGMFSKRRLVLPLFFLTTAIVVFSFLLSHDLPAAPGRVNGRTLVLCFFAGLVIDAFRDRLPWSISGGVAAFVGASLLLASDSMIGCLAPLLAAYGTVSFGLTNPKRSAVVNSGDYSYGVYLYSGPIQGTVTWAMGASVTWAANLAFALPLSVAFALFSWWCVEKPSLKLRRFLVATTPRPLPASSGTSTVEEVPELRPAAA